MTKRLVGLFLAVAMLFGLVPGVVYADAKPYFKAFGGDVSAGGWINSGASSCSTADPNYQAPTFSPIANQYRGGILTYANSTRHGSSTDFGAYALGLIEGSSGSEYGFFSGPSGTNTLSFSNTNNASGNYWGGYWAGATPQVHCITDYYGTKQNSPTNLGTAASISIGNLSSGQYIVTPVGASVDITSASGTIANGRAITLFVNGNAYITKNVRYTSGYNTDNVPKLAVIAKGEIYIDPSVDRIDGLYIAQPTSGATGGNIWTCHDGTNTSPDGYWVGSNCDNQLVINGALIAKQVVFLRVNGDLASAPNNESSNGNNIAEVINYTPSMVIGGSFFNPAASQVPTINSLISLPPVF